MTEKEEDASSKDSEIRNFNFHLLKADNDLFDDSTAKIKNTVVSVKRIRRPKQNEDWVILEDGKIVLKMKGTRFTKAEKNFLYTANGMKFLVAEYKAGTKSVVKFKQKIKKIL